LEQALEGKINEIQIYLKTAEAAPKIKEFLDNGGKGRSKVTVYADLGDDERTAQINIPGHWSLGSKARNSLRTQKGVLEITES